MLMNTPKEQPQPLPDNQAPLTPLADFRKSGRAPVEMHHLIFHNKKSLIFSGIRGYLQIRKEMAR